MASPDKKTFWETISHSPVTGLVIFLGISIVMYGVGEVGSHNPNILCSVGGLGTLTGIVSWKLKKGGFNANQ